MLEEHRLPEINGTGQNATVRLIDHLNAIRDGDIALQEERDRRYAEVNVEKEKALKIKETADLAALQLAREIQTYKDEKANELREQISSERGTYVTKDELSGFLREIQSTIKPLSDYVASQQGGSKQSVSTRANITVIISLIVMFAIVLGLLAPHIK